VDVHIDARDYRYCGLYTVLLPFDSRVALSLRESVSRVRVCVRHANDYIQANIALLVLISLVNNVITNCAPPPPTIPLFSPSSRHKQLV
jgi:hypothetical protein